MTWLTKIRFLSGLQCPKRLWLEVHEPLDEPLVEAINLLNGRAVDELVRRIEPGVAIPWDLGMPHALAETARVMRSGAPPVLHQPAFRSGDLVVIADVLRHRMGSCTLLEVKASTTVKPHHLPDATFQTLVLRRAGVSVDRVLVGHVNNQFVLRSPGDYADFLVEQDVTQQVEESLPAMELAATTLLHYMAGSEAPKIKIGPQCTSPYKCPFLPRCRAERGASPAYPVTLLPRGGKTVERLVADGYEDLETVPVGRLKGAIHLRIHQATASGEPFFDAEPACELRSLAYPMAHLDFETIGFAVPELVGARPYEQLPFQFSVHVEKSADSVRHHEYLAEDSFGDLDALARALLVALPDSGPVFAYNAPFERGVLLQLAERVPEQANALREVAERLVDLLPITRAAYYHRDMRGSWSIKAVLPTIAPELDYANLGEVQEGEGAQLAYLQLRDAAPGSLERARTARALKKYCERDTWGMVVLRRFLCGMHDSPASVTRRSR